MAAWLMAWALPGQRIAPLPWAGALLVVAAVMAPEAAAPLTPHWLRRR